MRGVGDGIRPKDSRVVCHARSDLGFATEVFGVVVKRLDNLTEPRNVGDPVRWIDWIYNSCF